MKKLDKFILKAFIGPFFAILLVVVFILMMQFLWLYIDELVGKGLGLGVIMEFMMWGACTILPLALPLATLLSSMMVLGSMGENKELMAIKTAGISLGRVMIPLIGASFVISIGAFYAGNNLVPKAYNEIFTLRDDILHTKAEIKIPSGTFYEGIDGYVLRTEDQDKNTGMLHGVMVYDHTGHKGNTSLIMADSAMLKIGKNKDYLTFTLYNGSSYQETNDKQYRDTSLALQRIDFKKQELIIPLKNYAFEKSDSSRFGDQVKSMNLSQLIEEKASLDERSAAAHDKHYAQLRTGSYFNQRTQLDTASTGLKDRENFSAAEMWRWKNIDMVVQATQNAAQAAKRMSSDVMSFNHEVYDCNFFRYRTDIELLKKFAQALACFIMFFIGAPLGTLIKKGGLGTSAIVSVLFFVLYWVIDISGTKLARDGTVSAWNGVFISAYLLIPIGIFLTWKAVNDAELFNVDNLKAKWRKIWSRFSSMFRKTRIVYMGTPDFAVAPLDALISKGYNVVGVVSVADKPSGRGLKLGESAVKKYAVEHNIPVLQPVKLKDPQFLDALREWKADLFVVVAFRMLPEEVWKMPRLGTFNLHAALLPQYRGAAPINWAVINGEKMTGVTTFMIDKDIDTGGIILREECRITDDDNAGTVHDKLMEIGAKLVVETVEGIIEKNVETRMQRSFIQGSEVLKPAPKLNRELCHIDWNDSTKHIHNLIRGLSPYPAAFTELVQGNGVPLQMKIYESEQLTGIPQEALAEAGISGLPEPGSIWSDGRTYLAIATADGAISVRNLQLSGKKRMDAADFLRGFREPGSYKCTQGTSRAFIEALNN